MTTRNVALLVLALLAACSPVNLQTDASFEASLSDQTSPPDNAQSPSSDASVDVSQDTSIEDAQDSGGDASVGSGGAGGITCQSVQMATQNGVTYRICVATIEGIELKLIAPNADADPAPWWLALYLHGDGARAHDNNTAPRLQAPWTSTHRALYVSARAPNRCAWWLRPGYTACDGTVAPGDIDTTGENARAFATVISTLRARYNVRTDATLFAGSSGGSFFLTASFLPMFGATLRGAFALGCGAHAPWSNSLAWNGRDAALRGPTSLYFTYGDQDEFLADIRGGIGFYRTEGFLIDERVLAGLGHCAFDHIGRAVEVWQQYSSTR
ncbi:MAG: hypothetical protein Q8Q09_27325 [Deltaproteobacteria bacterium]|nr:hypothetical protein [Deltaproteobacteria bacterium]